jgi:hypothetical protein
MAGFAGMIVPENDLSRHRLTGKVIYKERRRRDACWKRIMVESLKFALGH